MAVKFLGQYLLEQGLLTREQLLEALEVQRQCSPMLGELAVEAGLLDARQAQTINDRQRQEDKRFGDIAAELGLLDAAQVDQLLALQKSRRKLFGEILTERGMLTRAQLEQALAEQQAERASAEQDYRQALAGHPLEREIALAIDTANKQFTRILKSRSQFSAVRDAPLEQVDRVSACIEVEASRRLLIGLAADPATTRQIACAFMRIKPERCDDELARDALGELLNVIMGYVIRDTLADDEGYTPSPPDLDLGLPALAAKADHALTVAMTSELGEFELLVGR
ncbi:chemotaxis protein CheX [Pseudomarimonas salicorniae]|uniref:Chemotaxis protein CheX n=1 Tax=Pseudomarimonas salicorniae TaxID=2933270 RepID=A0ABT0GFJ3_9GAMM|nr:chemotaxis protein CheX [Lysobacter sp. CAU 1642]MCK7592800.1 chemotaxis protein CheX [Lysobacter sp. CAU 1642]